MKYDPDRHHRRSIRLKGYDYSQPGWYFVTVCVQKQKGRSIPIKTLPMNQKKSDKNVSPLSPNDSTGNASPLTA
ncbi:hypothetical protein BMS3Bbin03_00347 [bacterium BMS3Bbin03]|nr:hypothetical protein BMS3Bbin03_00347 [bacterium BMS3Bbin03]